MSKKDNKISSKELREWKTKFYSFQTPDELMNLHYELREIVGRENFYNKGGLTFLQEAHVLATYGQLVKAEKVRLVPEQLNQNDCEIVLNGEKRTYEITEVMEEGRKRGDEYKGKPDNSWRYITDEQMRQSSISGFRQFRTIIESKASKGYDNSVGLIVYYNVSDFDEDDYFVAEITKILESIEYEFPTINLLHNVDISTFPKMTLESSTALLQESTLFRFKLRDYCEFESSL